MAANRFNDLLKKAHGAIAQLRGGGANYFLGKNGEVIFSKNNVCVHETGGDSGEEEAVHSPGYLTIHCSEDEQLGITLILQWLPNALLEKAPSSIRCVSPLRGRVGDEKEEAGGDTKNNAQVTRFTCSNRSHTVDSDDGENVARSAGGEASSVVVRCEVLNGALDEHGEEGQSQLRPQSLIGLFIPSIHLIPNTPVDQQDVEEKIRCDRSESSEPTSGEDLDEEEDKADAAGDCYSSSGDDEQEELAKSRLNEQCLCARDWRDSGEEEAVHSPGYLTIHCSEDEQLGITLILQWLPNALLEKAPSRLAFVRPCLVLCMNNLMTLLQQFVVLVVVGVVLPQFLFCIRCVSPLRGRVGDEKEEAGGDTKNSAQVTRFTCSNRSHTVDSDDGENVTRSAGGEASSVVVRCEVLNGALDEHGEEGQSQLRPQSLIGLFIPSIHLIPNTPVDQQDVEEKIRCDRSESSEPTSGEDLDEEEDKFADAAGDCYSSSGDDEQEELAKMKSLDAIRKSCAVSLARGAIPEQFARKMRSMRVFYSDTERTSGQLVIASPDSQYKIFHFHHTGLDKLTQLFERWNAVKAKSAVGNDSPTTNGQERHLLISPGAETELARTELDPEDGLYERLGWEMWRSYVSTDGSVEDGFTIRKNVYFSSMEPSLRKELWPFLLRIYPWNSTAEQRESIRNELFLRYQRLKGQRIRKMAKPPPTGEGVPQQQLAGVAQSIVKDVLRTDRRSSFFAGEENSNLDTMKSILLTYAVKNPEIGYIQGMSDLLAPLLCTLRDEPLTYWCFVHLIEQTLFRQPNRDEHRSEMDVQLEYIRELLRLFTPNFHAHLAKLGADAPNLMFVHRWILLFFKREFPSRDSLHIWEACWSRYRTNYFHLFIACAIVSIYGPDVVAQNLPHDEILFYFSSLSMHMDAHLILRKARGLLYQFHRLSRIPCTLAGLCSHETGSDQWTSHIEPHGQFECTQKHGENGEEQCPFATVQ
uniref:Rab-GAP TBC domain-containing protein n=1 Tax=Globodera pallida TaxID=36090 RepID=A0A183CAJ3_GLOPA